MVWSSGPALDFQVADEEVTGRTPGSFFLCALAHCGSAAADPLMCECSSVRRKSARVRLLRAQSVSLKFTLQCLPTDTAIFSNFALGFPVNVARPLRQIVYGLLQSGRVL